MAASRASLSAGIARVCRKLSEKGFVAAQDGNVSARYGRSSLLITASGKAKGDVRTADIVEVGLDGKVPAKKRRPSSELAMHLALYRRSAQVGAVVHAHPPYATAFAVSRVPLTPRVFPEVVLTTGDIPLVEYAMPSSDELGELVAAHAERSRAAILVQHGAVAWGRNLEEAYLMMEKLEHAAQVEFFARMLGGPKTLTAEQAALLRARHPLAEAPSP